MSLLSRVSPIFTRAINCKILLHQPPDDGPHERERYDSSTATNQPTTTTRTKEQRTAPTIAAPQQQERACVSLSWVSIGWCIDLTGWLGWLVGLVGWLVLANHRAQRACIHPYSISRHDPRHRHTRIHISHLALTITTSHVSITVTIICDFSDIHITLAIAISSTTPTTWSIDNDSIGNDTT